MPWVRFEDDWYDDDELSDAHPLSVLLWVAAISWSARNLKDGVIPAGRVDMLVNWRRAGVPDPQPHVDELVALGKWSPVPSGGFLINHYHDYQPTRASVLEKREADAARKRGRSGLPPPDLHSDSAGNPTPPGPGPEGSLKSVVVDVLETSPQPGDDGGRGDVPEAVWVEYARLKRDQSKEPVRNISRYDAQTIANGKLEHGATASRWLTDFDLSPSELAQGLVQGKAAHHWTRRRSAS